MLDVTPVRKVGHPNEPEKLSIFCAMFFYHIWITLISQENLMINELQAQFLSFRFETKNLIVFATFLVYFLYTEPPSDQASYVELYVSKKQHVNFYRIHLLWSQSSLEIR